MQIWFLTAWLGCSDSHPTPLWRHPEVSFLDWLCQLLMPLLAPFKRIVGLREPSRTARIVKMREQMATMELKSHDKLFAGWSASVIELTRADGSTLLVHLHRPPPPTAGAAGSTEQGSEKPLPLVLWLHGGGFTVGGARDSVGPTYATELLSLGRPVAWASVDYRLAPEHPHPAAPDDALSALEYFAADSARCASLGIDAQSIHLAGSSAGAGLAAVVAAEATARRGVAVRSLLADEPMLDPRCAYAMHVPYAYAMPMLCLCLAYAVPMPCSCHAAPHA
jgi:acetyl esterase/lipase